MTDRELEQALRAWYRDEVGAEDAPADLRASLAAIPRTTPVPLRERPRSRGPILLAAAALVLLGGAVAAGSGLLRLAPVAPPIPSVALLASPPPSPSTLPSPSANVLRNGDLVVFTRAIERATTCSRGRTACPVSRLFIARPDGSDARELIPNGVGQQSIVAWSPDGSHLLYVEDEALYLADPRGGDPEAVDTGCPTRSVAQATCVDGQFAVSSDGRRLVFGRTTFDDRQTRYPEAIATLDLQTGQVLELASTSPAGGVRPGWSPDGTQIVFSRGGTKDSGGPTPRVMDAVFVIGADGLGLRQISQPTMDAMDAVWSPDGKRIVFWSPAGDPLADLGDLYSIRPDGSDLQRLTTDGTTAAPSWTPEGRIMYIRAVGGADGGADATDAGWWTMAADGSDQALFVRASALGIPVADLPFRRLAVQPLGGAAIVPPPWTPVAAAPVGPAAPTPSPTPIPDLADGFSWAGTTTTSEGSPLGETATRLLDGRVLITEGCGTGAELYDPTTGTFSPTGSLTATRGSKTATLLRDGRVLFAGGYNCARAGQDGIWATAELYDPTTGTFSRTGSMTTPREMQTATLLADGRVLITGGITGSPPSAASGITLASIRTVDTSSNVLASAEIYDPVTGLFGATGSMHGFRNDHTATLLADGRVLVVGGGGEGYASRASAELFDPASGTFTKTGSLHTGRWLHTATLLPDGRVLILGGRSPKDSVYRSAEIYDPGSEAFSKAGSMTKGRQQHTATLLADGRVLITGGLWSDGKRWRVLDSAETYDPGAGTFASIGSMGTPREGHTATLLTDGRVLVAGGADIGAEGGVGVTSAVLYQP